MKTYAFIFARGGSKGLPRKNIKELVGKPLIVYSVEIAKKCDSISKVFVSTDDEEISSIASAAGAEVIQRPSELASDTASEWLAWRHAIEYAVDKYGQFDTFVSLPATSPLRAQSDVERALQKLKSSDADICIAITPSSRSPYFNMVQQDLNGYLSLAADKQSNITRRQDAPTVYDITTVVYASNPAFILNNLSIFSGKVVSIEVPKERAVDIDDIYDFLFAEALINAR